MWHRVLAWMGVVGLAGSMACAQPAFPGAEGFGAIATGGEGGREIWVTTLAPDGPGSLREAVDAEGPRTVKFQVPVADLAFHDQQNRPVVEPGEFEVQVGDLTAPFAVR